jgi:maltose alpha-D-glucosyltransferase / alpha-amylase
MRDLWYKNAIIYCLDVDTFQDSNGDGIGDFEGLTRRLDYLAGLGVTCLWLLPFYPTPNKDNGYDVMDYYTVDPRLGTLGDFVEFTRQAHDRGIRILIDLVVNHTSDQHPWFQSARMGRHSPYHDYYVWADEKPDGADDEVIFPGVQESTWSWDQQVGAYYHHRFYKHQPDLNIENPEVRREICKIMGFWLALGVSGFRLDAAPFLIEMQGMDGGASDPYRYLREFRDFLSWRRGDAILLAEANVELEQILEYFGDGDKMHMLFNFTLNQQLFLSLARENVKPLVKGLKEQPQPPETGQWVNFVRNHDELSLDKLSDRERREIFEAFAPDPDMQLYERGVRRRLPPMLDGDAQRLALAYSLLFTLPGTPVLRYGEEIGMGDDLSLEERESVRTPMQWADEANAGFSTAHPEALQQPVIADGPFSYQEVNVARQRRDPGSLLNRIERMIRYRREAPEFGWGEWRLIETSDPSVLAMRYEWEGRVVIAAHNLNRKACRIKLKLDEPGEVHLIDLLGDDVVEVGDDSYEMKIEGYGYRWIRIHTVNSDQHHH